MKLRRSSLVVPHDRLPTNTVLLTGAATAATGGGTTAATAVFDVGVGADVVDGAREGARTGWRGGDGCCDGWLLIMCCFDARNRDAVG